MIEKESWDALIFVLSCDSMVFYEFRITSGDVPISAIDSPAVTMSARETGIASQHRSNVLRSIDLSYMLAWLTIRRSDHLSNRIHLASATRGQILAIRVVSVYDNLR